MVQGTQRYEYEFVRLGEGLFGAKRKARDDYQNVVHQRAREGWRLVQVFAPGTGIHGVARYFELVFERPAS
jgi:hypothetical protein